MTYIWLFNLLSVFLLSIILSGIVIPEILLIAFRRRLFDEVNERKIHHCTVPRLGGIAFKPVIFVSMALILGVNITLGRGEFLNAIEVDALPLTFAFCAMMTLYLVGIADDLIGVRYRAKFCVQLLCSLMLLAGGAVFSDFHGMFFLHEMPSWVSYPITIFITIFIINAINLIDGIDGLASGLCSITFLCYGLSFCYFGYYVYAMIAFAGLGVLIPFYYYNVFGKAEQGKKIFMGDTGSLTIGMLLCFLSIRLTNIAGSDTGLHQVNPIVLAYAPLLVPCLDVVRVYLHRVRHGKNPFLPDRNHIHHKLLDIGMPQRTAMVTIVLASLAVTLINIVLSAFWNITILLLLDIVLWIDINIRLTRRINAETAEAAEPVPTTQSEEVPQ